MKNVKSTITRIKNKCIEKLPDGNDIYNYQGISKEIILQSLDDGYYLSNIIEEYEGKLETIILKRKIASIAEKLNKYWDIDFDNKNTSDDFNKFLNIIVEIHYYIKDTYILLAKEPIRTEIEINKAKEQLSELQEGYSNLKEIDDELKIIKADNQEYIKRMKGTFEGTMQYADDISNYYNRLTTMVPEIANKESKIQIYHDRINDNMNSIEEYNEQIENIQKKHNTIKEEIEKYKNSIEEINSEYLKINNNTRNQSEKIAEVLSDANRYGMAASFRDRKSELKRAMMVWGISSVVAIIVLLVISFCIVKPVIDNSFSISHLLTKSPIFFASIWLAWFCSKQYGFNVRIYEDYSYKYAISQAFEGYKKEVKDINEEILNDLINLTISNISVNPTYLYNTKNNHASPYHEFFENVKSIFAKKTSDKGKTEK